MMLNEIKKLKQWVNWKAKKRNGKMTKIPVDPVSGKLAKSNDPDTWNSYDIAKQNADRYDGIGFMFANGYFGVDIDDIKEDIDRYQKGEKENNIVYDFISSLKTYAEVSVSGNGIHLIAKGSLPPGRRKRDNVEMYDTNRFFVMTENPLKPLYPIRDCTETIKPLHSKYLEEGKKTNSRAFKPIQIDYSKAHINSSEINNLSLEDKFNYIRSKSTNIKNDKGDSFMCSCPVHDDKNPSLTWSIIGDHIKFNCLRKCNKDDIKRAYGITSKFFLREDKMTENNIIAEYKYYDEENEYIFSRIRYKNKQFRFRSNQGYSKPKGVRLLYRLPELVEGIKANEVIYIFEGEKDVETALKWGLTSTSGDLGINTGVFKVFKNYFLDTEVVIVPDNDKPGNQYAIDIYKILKDTALSIKIINLNSDKKGYDFTDYVEEGHTKEDFKKLVKLSKEVNSKTVDELAKSWEITEVEGGGDLIQKSKNGYICVTDDEIKLLTNFRINIFELIEIENKTTLKAKITNNEGYTQIKEFPAEYLKSERTFLNDVLGTPLFSYFPKRGVFSYLEQYIINSSVYKHITGVGHMGIHEINGEEYFITHNKAINKNLEEVDDKVFKDRQTGGEASYKNDILDVEAITKEELKKISKYLFKFNSLEITASILGTIASHFLKPKLFKLGERTPQLIIYGQSGAGKTQTLDNIINPFFSNNRVSNARGIKEFVSVKDVSESNNIPVIFDEYKPAKMRKSKLQIVSDIIVNSYDCSEEGRGTEKQTVNRYPLLAPIVMLGEEGQEETAILERSIIVQMSKRESRREKRTEVFKHLKEHKHLIQKLGRSVLNEVMKLSYSELKTALTKCDKLLSDIDEDRVRNNLRAPILGLGLLKSVFNNLSLNFNEETNVNELDLVNALKTNIYNEVLGYEGNTKSEISKIFDIMNNLAYRNILEPEEHYKFFYSKKIGSECLAIDTKNIYSDITRYEREYNLKDEIGFTTEEQFIKQLRTQDYYVDCINKVNFKKEGRARKTLSIRCIIDVEKARREGLDLDNFKGSTICNFSPLTEEEEEEETKVLKQINYI